jgi:hypothetical protein
MTYLELMRPNRHAPRLFIFFVARNFRILHHIIEDAESGQICHFATMHAKSVILIRVPVPP